MSSYQTALALVLPEHLWPAVQVVRSQHDKAYPRWPPHITLAFPFVPPDQLPAIEAALSSLTPSCSPFTITLDEFGYFQQRPDRSTLYLAPTQPQPLLDLHAALAPALQLATDRPFTPHLTLGQFGDEADTLDNLGRIQMSWEPLSWSCSEVCLLEKNMETGHFTVRSRFALGSGGGGGAVPSGPKLVIMSDRTGSMGGFLRSVQQTMTQVSAISQLLFQGKLHVGLLVYGDYDSPLDNVVAWSGYCSDLKQLQQFITDEVKVRWSGGDTPEAQKTAFNRLLPLVDQETVVLHYTDAPPHHFDNWNGSGLAQLELKHLQQQQLETDWVRLCQALDKTGMRLYTVCNSSAFNLITFYMLLGPVMKLEGVTPDSVLRVTMVALQQLMGITDCSFAQDTTEIVWAEPPQLQAQLGETHCHGYLPGGPLRQGIRARRPQLDSLPWLQVDLANFSRQFHQDELFRETCFDVFEHLLRDNLVMCLTYNDVFGTLWRQICKCREDPRREQLVDALSRCCQTLPSQDAVSLRAWIDRSYNAEEEIKELIAAAPRPCASLYSAAAPSFTKDDMLNLARGNLNRDVLAKLTELLTELLETDAAAGLPLSLSNKQLFSVLPHLFCPGLQFSLRPSLIMAILAYTLDVAPLKERALAFLQQQRGRWINVSKKGDGDSAVYAVPENFSGQFVELVSKLLDREPAVRDSVLTQQEQQLYQQLARVNKLQQNGRKPFNVCVGVTPKGQLLPDATVECSRCHRHRSVSIMAELGEAPVCGLCHYNVPPDTYPAGPGEGRSHLYSCCTCGSLYAVVDTGNLRVRPKCHWCRQQTPLARIPRVHCRSCGNHYLVPSMPDKEAAHIDVCTLCAEAPREAVVEKAVTLQELAQENPCVVRLFGMPDTAAAVLFDSQIGSLLKRYQKLQPLLDTVSDSAAMPQLTFKNKRILNMASLQPQLEQEILHGSVFQDCCLCFSSLPVNSLDSACGQCDNRVCPQCRRRWYSQCSPGNVVFESHLCCPFCKQRPSYAVLKRSNKRLAEIVKRCEPFQPGQWHAWCSRCYVVKEAAARECAREPPNFRGSFVCVDCQDRKPDGAKLCPSCGIATEKAGGCNHITCACGAHWCWLCGDATFSGDEQDTGGAGDIYHHLWAVHGGYGFGDA